MRQHLVLGIGELLWDQLPEGEKLGGAPANFAVMAARLGNRAAVLSRVGRDDLGRRAIAGLEPLPVDQSQIQIDRENHTGVVTVQFEDGQPQYTIHHPSAWDFLELTSEWVSLAKRAGAICFGSLAQRTLESRQTIQTLVAQTAASCVRVFDVNLRAPFYSSEVIVESLELASVLKMNDFEMPLLQSLLGLPVEDARRPEVQLQCARRLLEEFPSLDLVALTRGANGSLLVRRQDFHDHPGIPVEVADTIGAGDAFTAALIHYLLRGAPLAIINEAANRWGSWLASQAGAMPELSASLRRRITLSIESVAR